MNAYATDTRGESIKIFELTFSLSSKRMEAAHPDWTIMHGGSHHFLGEVLKRAILTLMKGEGVESFSDIVNEAFNNWGNNLVLNFTHQSRAILARRGDNGEFMIVLEDPQDERTTYSNAQPIYRLMCYHSSRKPQGSFPNGVFSRDPADVKKLLLGILA